MALFNLGSSISTTLNTTSNKIQNNLTTSAGASASVTCSISIGNITMENSKGCYITVSNLCSADASAALEAVISAGTQVLEQLNVEEKEAFIPSLVKFGVDVNTTVNTLVNDFRTAVTNTCTASSIVNNTIDIQNVSFPGCDSGGVPIEFKFINTGQASANCAVNILLNSHMDLVNEISVKKTSGIDLDFSSIITIVLIFFGAIIIMYSIYKMLSKYNELSPSHVVKLGAQKKLPWAVSLWLLNQMKTGD